MLYIYIQNYLQAKRQRDLEGVLDQKVYPKEAS
jgi:hypothetical protein